MKLSTNPSAIYSKDCLADALNTLMNTYSYEEITITQIVEYAQLSRRTYYRHFNSKEEIVRYSILRLIHQYESYIVEHKFLTFEQFFRAFFILCMHHQTFLLNLTQNHLLYLLIEECTTALPQLYHQLSTQIIDLPAPLDAPTLDFLITFNVGGALNVALNWINEGMTSSVDELCLKLSFYKKMGLSH